MREVIIWLLLVDVAQSRIEFSVTHFCHDVTRRFLGALLILTSAHFSSDHLENFFFHLFDFFSHFAEDLLLHGV